MKFSERRMEVRTSATCICLDDLRVGVKSLSNLAMAGSCRNMPKYSLTQFSYGVKLRIKFAEATAYGTFSNSEPVICVMWEWRAVRKVLFEDPNKGD